MNRPATGVEGGAASITIKYCYDRLSLVITESNRRAIDSKFDGSRSKQIALQGERSFFLIPKRIGSWFINAREYYACEEEKKCT